MQLLYSNCPTPRQECCKASGGTELSATFQDAVGLVLPSSVGAGAHQLPAMAGQGPELEALAAADFVEHCLTAHNAVIQKVNMALDKLASTFTGVLSTLSLLHRVTP